MKIPEKIVIKFMSAAAAAVSFLMSGYLFYKAFTDETKSTFLLIILAIAVACLCFLNIAMFLDD